MLFPNPFALPAAMARRFPSDRNESSGPPSGTRPARIRSARIDTARCAPELCPTTVGQNVVRNYNILIGNTIQVEQFRVKAESITACKSPFRGPEQLNLAPKGCWQRAVLEMNTAPLRVRAENGSCSTTSAISTRATAEECARCEGQCAAGGGAGQLTDSEAG